jgi:hypothetical protein
LRGAGAGGMGFDAELALDVLAVGLDGFPLTPSFSAIARVFSARLSQ